MPDNAISRYNKKYPPLTFRVPPKTKEILITTVNKRKIMDKYYSLNKLLLSIVDEWLERNGNLVITRKYKILE